MACVMAQILKFIPRDSSFDPETLTLLGTAYDRAIASLRDKGQPESVYEIMAQRIIASATKGERDPDKLTRIALRGITPRD